MKKISQMINVLVLISVLVFAMPVYGQTAQTKKQSLPEQAGFVLQDGTVYTVDQSMTLDGNSTGGFINGLAVADGATVTLYIPSGVTLTVIGQDANIKDAGGNVIESQKGAGAGIYVPASSTLYITGAGTLIAQGGNGGNGGAGTNGTDGTISGSSAKSGRGGDGGYGGGGGAAAIGGNGGDGGAVVAGALESQARKRKGTTGANGNPMLPTSTEYNGNNGSNGGEMGNVYILGQVKVQTTAGSSNDVGGAAGKHGSYKSGTSGNVTLSAGGGGAGAGGGAGVGATYGIGGGGAGAGSGAAGASGAADRYDGKNLTFNDVNMYGNGGSSTGAGEGAANGNIIIVNDAIRDNGADASGRFPRFGGYGGSVGGKAGTQGGNGTVYVEHDSEANLSSATIGNLVTLQESETETALAALNVSIKLNFLNDGNPNSGVLSTHFGDLYTQLFSELIPTRPGYDFVGYFTQAVGGTQVFDKDGNPATTGARCTYVQDENPTLYAHWILSTYTVTWKYDYYSVDQQSMVSVPQAERSTQANVTIRLTDGNTHTMTMTNPSPTETQTTHTVTLRDVLSTEVFNKVVSVEKVEPVDVAGAANALMTLDYVSESSAKIFYDPTRYMVRWNVSVSATNKPEYIILTIKRGTTDDAADGDIPTDGNYKEDVNIFQELRVRQNASGTYSGSAVLMYEQDGNTPFHYTVSVVGVRDASGNEYMFPTPVSSKGMADGIMYCSKPTEQNPTPQKNIDEITITVELKQLDLDANGGVLDDGTPEDIWAPTGTTVSLKDGASYPYTATRLNYNFEGWALTDNATESVDNVTLATDQTVYAVFMDRTPPTITFGDYTRNGSANNYRVPVTISDAISTQNVVYYTVYDTNPGDIPVDDDTRWGTQKGKTQKKAEVVNIDFTSTSVVYVHVKAVDESGNAAVASKEIKVDTEAPVVHAYPNVDSFCAVDVDVDVTDNVGVTSLTISPNVTTTTDGNITSLVLTKPTSGSQVYTITATDAAGNETVRTITIYASHNFPDDNSTMIAAIEPTATTEGYYRYKKCEHCSHIILLRGDSKKEIDITDEGQRGAWIIPAGVVMVMEPWNGTLDIVDYGTYVNDALTKTNTINLNATQVRLAKDTQVANNTNTLTTPSRSIDLELNGHGLLQQNGNAGDITGNNKVTILLSDGNNINTRGETGVDNDCQIPYTNKSTVTGSPLKYVRHFSDIQMGNWQALYLPVGFTYKTNDDYKLAKYKETNDFTQEDNGHVVIRIEELENEKTASGPLFIKSNVEKIEIDITGTALPAATPYGNNRSTPDGAGFTFIGTLYDSPASAAANPFWVMLNNGTMWWGAEGQTQRPYRWVIQPSSSNPAKSITFEMVESDPNGINDISNEANGSTHAAYTIDGRKLMSTDNLSRGIYIIDGKKVFIK